jgi:hypothetical protein
MSNRWPGGVIRKTPVTPAGPLQNGAASGVWTLADAAYWTKQGLWPLAGNTLAVEDVFSTWLYTGNDTAQTITNGIDLAGKGGLVWTKGRSTAYVNGLVDTARGALNTLISNSTDGSTPSFNTVTAFTSSGFSVGTSAITNAVGTTYASWTFRKAPKFFDVVTYTGNGVAGRQIAHNLGVAPGMMIVKMTSGVEGWYVYHRGTSSPANKALVLNTTSAENAGSVGYWNNTAPTSTNFTLGSNYEVNNNGSTYVAYLYAHDTASDGIIQCGSYTGNGSTTGPTVNLGWEAQWVLIKSASAGAGPNSWVLFDNMRGMSVTSSNMFLHPNLSAAEQGPVDWVQANATGFQLRNVTGSTYNQSGETYVYMAIRRGPMKTPTLGTSVYNAVVRTGTGGNADITSVGFPTDLVMSRDRQSADADFFQFFDRLRGPLLNIKSTQTTGENSAGSSLTSFASMNGFSVGADTEQNGINRSTSNYVYECFKRAPSFFDEVCYTGTGSATTFNHNLGVAPELMIVKRRNTTGDWQSYSAALANTEYLVLNSTAAKATGATRWNSTSPTSTVLTVGTDATVNASGGTYVAYLFASCPGVSKVGSYTGNGSSQTINCAFTTGSRFVLIKRTDSTGGWLVWDSARGIVAGNDPYLALNSTAAEVTTNDSVDTDNTGFIVNQVAASDINVNGATYIFLAIA